MPRRRAAAISVAVTTKDTGPSPATTVTTDELHHQLVDEVTRGFHALLSRYNRLQRKFGVEMFLRQPRNLPIGAFRDAAAAASAESQHWRSLLLLLLRAFDVKSFATSELILGNAVYGLHRWLQWSLRGRPSAGLLFADDNDERRLQWLTEFSCINALRFIEAYISRLQSKRADAAADDRQQQQQLLTKPPVRRSGAPAKQVHTGEVIKRESDRSALPAAAPAATEADAEEATRHDVAAWDQSLQHFVQSIHQERHRVEGPKSLVPRELQEMDARCWEDRGNVCSVCQETRLPPLVPLTLSLSIRSCASVANRPEHHCHTSHFSPRTFRCISLYDPQNVVANCKCCGYVDMVVDALCPLCDGLFR
jgi:hypothetical protein